MSSAAREIARTLARLAASDGRPRARKNARLALRQLLRECWREADAAWPPLRPDGSAIERRDRRGAVCPACGAPMASFSALAAHAIVRHRGHDKSCWCGWRPRMPAAFSSPAKAAAWLGAHLRGVHARGELAAHAALGGLGGSHPSPAPPF